MGHGHIAKRFAIKQIGITYIEVIVIPYSPQKVRLGYSVVYIIGLRQHTAVLTHEQMISPVGSDNRG
ncbi:hypothetical protein D3C71_1748630 [compost metagenome]